MLNAIYKGWLAQEKKQATLFPDVIYKRFISRSHGKNRPRKSPVEVELVSFGGGVFHKPLPHLIDRYLDEAFEGIALPPNANHIEYLLEELRCRY